MLLKGKMCQVIFHSQSASLVPLQNFEVLCPPIIAIHCSCQCVQRSNILKWFCQYDFNCRAKVVIKQLDKNLWYVEQYVFLQLYTHSASF